MQLGRPVAHGGGSQKNFLVFLVARRNGGRKKIPQGKNSIILLEEEGDRKEIYSASKAVMKIFWLLGGKYRLIGAMYLMPAFIMDPWYRLIARNRYRLFASRKSPPLDQSRLLP